MKLHLVSLALSSVAWLLVGNVQAQDSTAMEWANTKCSQCEEKNVECKTACSVDCGICQEPEQTPAWLVPKCQSQCSPKCNCAVGRPLVEPCLSYCSGTIPLTRPVTATQPNATVSDESAASDFDLGTPSNKTATDEQSVIGNDSKSSHVDGNSTATLSPNPVVGSMSHSSDGMQSLSPVVLPTNAMTQASDSPLAAPLPPLVDADDEYVTNFTFDVRPVGDALPPVETPAKGPDCHA